MSKTPEQLAKEAWQYLQSAAQDSNPQAYDCASADDLINNEHFIQDVWSGWIYDRVRTNGKQDKNLSRKVLRLLDISHARDNMGMSKAIENMVTHISLYPDN